MDSSIHAAALQRIVALFDAGTLEAEAAMKALSGTMKGKPLMLLNVAFMALQNAETKQAGQELARFRLGIKLAAGGEIELTSEEKTVLLESIKQTYPSPLVFGRACELIDPAMLK